MENKDVRVPEAPGSRLADGAELHRLHPSGFDPSRLSHHGQMLDAQSGCVPCKLCGGKAVISDAGPGAGYYIQCANSESFRASNGCLIDERRLGGWAYNVRDWWNRLHASDSDRNPEGQDAVERLGAEHESAGPQDIAEPSAQPTVGG